MPWILHNFRQCSILEVSEIVLKVYYDSYTLIWGIKNKSGVRPKKTDVTEWGLFPLNLSAEEKGLKMRPGHDFCSPPPQSPPPSKSVRGACREGRDGRDLKKSAAPSFKVAAHSWLNRINALSHSKQKRPFV